MSTMSRGHYGQLLNSATLLDTFKPCLPECYVEFDKHHRGDAVNVDLYGYDPDEQVGVVQIRHAFRRYKNGYMNVRKDYVLCGFNESGAPFRHPVSSSAVRAASRPNHSPLDTVRAAQRWMWQCTAKQLQWGRRQGDVLIVPERGLPKGDLVKLGTEATLADTHVVESVCILRDPNHPQWLYATYPTLRHTKGQHRAAMAPRTDSPWFTVRAARSAPAWNHSVRLGD